MAHRDPDLASIIDLRILNHWEIWQNTPSQNATTSNVCCDENTSPVHHIERGSVISDCPVDLFVVIKWHIDPIHIYHSHDIDSSDSRHRDWWTSHRDGTICCRNHSQDREGSTFRWQGSYREPPDMASRYTEPPHACSNNLHSHCLEM